MATMVDSLGGVDLADCEAAFVGLATAHLALARAVLPLLSTVGAYSVVVGQSAHHPGGALRRPDLGQPGGRAG